MLAYKKYQNILLVLLFTSGSLKVVLEYYDYPFDITLQIMMLIVLDIVYNMLIIRNLSFKKTEVFYVLIILSFYFLATFSLLYTSSDKFGFEKLFKMMIPLIGFIYIKFIKEIRFYLLYKVLIYVFIPLSIWFVFFNFLWSAGTNYFDFVIDKNKFGPFRNNYLNFGYLLGILILLAHKFAKSPLIIIFSAILIISLGSRGALVFVILSFGIIYFKQILNKINSFSVKKSIINKFAISLVPVIIFVLLFIDKLGIYFLKGWTRFSSLINIGSDSSALERINQYIFTIENGFTLKGFFLGHGLGSFGIDYHGVDRLGYPHNVFFESWYELGFFGMCILIIFLATPFFLSNRNSVIKMLALFAFLNAMKTLSFSQDRNLFILFGVLIFHGSANYFKQKLWK